MSHVQAISGAVPCAFSHESRILSPDFPWPSSSRPKSSSSQSQTQETEEEIVEPVSDRDRAEYHTRVTVAVSLAPLVRLLAMIVGLSAGPLACSVGQTVCTLSTASVSFQVSSAGFE